jgi:N6-L-threonylcarbamoyladenine synthase
LASAIRAGRWSRTSEVRQPGPLRAAAADAGQAQREFLALGLKTALRLEAEKIAPISDQDVRDLCASFQQAVVDVVADRLRAGLQAVPRALRQPDALVAAGGVAANEAIRKVLHRLAFEGGTAAGAPPAGALHRQRRHDRLGGRRAARARAHRYARHAPHARWPLSESGRAPGPAARKAG